jgi:hypothetical protein
MDAHLDLSFAVFQMVYFDNKNKGQLKFVKERKNYLYAYLRHDLPWHTMCPLWNLSFVKTYLKGYNEIYPRLQDPEFNTRALIVDNVKFDVLFNSEPDCYGRMHSNKVFNAKILLSGFKLYITEFSKKIKELPDYEECRQQLKQCYIEAVRGFYSYFKPEWDNESIRLLIEINKSSYKEGLIKRKTYLLTDLLILAYRARLNRVPLGKYVLRTIMKLIKMS